VKARPFFYLLLIAFLVWLVIVLLGRGSEAPAQEAPPEPQTTTVEVERTLQGRTVSQWHRAAQRYLSRSRSLQRAIHFDAETSTAIGLACIVYGYCGDLWRKAACESHLWRYARNPSGASGLYQFLPSTWRSTPFGRYSIFDPYASALAAGWMHARGRGGEWVCR
jgi:Transglycosylase SLT domain